MKKRGTWSLPDVRRFFTDSEQPLSLESWHFLWVGNAPEVWAGQRRGFSRADWLKTASIKVRSTNHVRASPQERWGEKGGERERERGGKKEGVVLTAAQWMVMECLGKVLTRKCEKEKEKKSLDLILWLLIVFFLWKCLSLICAWFILEGQPGKGARALRTRHHF